MRAIAVLCLALLVVVGGYLLLNQQAERLAQMETEKRLTTQGRFDRAVERLQLPRTDEVSRQQARLTIDRLSRADPPFIPANQFLATEIQKSGKFKSNANEFRELLRNLEIVADGGDVPSKMALVQFYVVSRQNSLAIARLRELVDQRPDLNLQLAQLLQRNGEVELAKMTARRAVEFHEKQLQLPSQKASNYIALASGFSLLDQHDDAIAVLEKAVQFFPELNKMLVGLLVEQSNRTQIVSKQTIDLPDNGDASAEAAEASQLSGAAFGFAKRAIEVDPSNLIAWSKLHEMTLGNDETSDQAAAMFDQFSENDDTNGAIELVKSVALFFESDIDGAIELLESAVKNSTPGSDNHVRAKNNLASYLAQTDPPQFDRAIEIVNQLVVDHPTAIETRGQILALAGRDVEAIADLTRVIQNHPSHEGAARTIARIWEKQGMAEKAAALRARVRQLREKPKTPTTVDPEILEEFGDHQK